MADFSWLNDLADGDWSSEGGQSVRNFSSREFAENSGVDAIDHAQFNQWGSTQQRKYRLADSSVIVGDPEPKVMVIWPHY
ncbi:MULTISPECIES: hypothetical protein [Stenotrophomonas]|uniref:hypothetical protein n=1 Tax=Stenotrophomonas TaxID=40323 RepID=UPI0008DC955A|nr:hypothetical protein [Stenotrophomonas maltophilia]OHY64644.1 hypothetical protein BB780_17640 [Stenotrophomonas maltophilia]